MSLMNAPIYSTWGISDYTAETWFLSKNIAVITRYGFDANNIGDVTAAIKAAGVSSVFFYAYTVNENGGADGFINHHYEGYYAENGGDTAVNAARGDADFASMPSVSIGRAYIPATAATTWEVYYPQGLLKENNKVQNYGAPLEGVLSSIADMSKY